MAKTKLKTVNKAKRAASLENPSDLTFNKLVSKTEAKFIVKAVGEILLEIQKYISTEAELDSQIEGRQGNLNFRTASETQFGEEARPPKARNYTTGHKEDNNVSSPSKEERRRKALKNKTLSDDERNPCSGDIMEPTDQTYHKRPLDLEVSAIKEHSKFVSVSSKNIGWGHTPTKESSFRGDVESYDLSFSNRSSFDGQTAAVGHPLDDVELDLVSAWGDVYNVNRMKLSINVFVTSFYQHYPIISYSSFILSLIYIDRFIKSQCAEDLSRLSNFSITR